MSIERLTPRYTVGDRVFSHYTMSCGHIIRDADDQGWYSLRMDDGGRELLNDERLMSLSDARRLGYKVD
jgi:hypothetical protein